MNWEEHQELEALKEKLAERYEVLALLGKGAFAKVFKLKDLKLGRECALKALNLLKLEKWETEERSDAQARFTKEAKGYAGCSHPNIVQIYDVGGEETCPYLVMEYICGITLKKLLEEKGKLALGETIEIAAGLLPAVGYMHEKALIHRDLKPANIMLEEGGKHRVVLIDFGIVKNVMATTMTASDIVLGTPYYMAPEMWQYNKTIGHTADIYSLGVMVFQMLTGEVPYQGSLPEIMAGHLWDPIPEIEGKTPDASPELQEIINKVMAKKPADRYQSATEFLNALRNLNNNS